MIDSHDKYRRRRFKRNKRSYRGTHGRIPIPNNKHVANLEWKFADCTTWQMENEWNERIISWRTWKARKKEGDTKWIDDIKEYTGSKFLTTAREKLKLQRLHSQIDQLKLKCRKTVGLVIIIFFSLTKFYWIIWNPGTQFHVMASVLKRRTTRIFNSEENSPNSCRWNELIHL